MIPAVLFRRSLVAAAVAAGSARLGKRALRFAVTGDRYRSLNALSRLCAGLNHAPEIGEACLRALPGINSKELLTGLILSDVVPIGQTFASVRTLAYLMRKRSHDDFRSGRIVVVNGWILSVTETRFYALSVLLSRT
jgi:hypothetical protein